MLRTKTGRRPETDHQTSPKRRASLVGRAALAVLLGIGTAGGTAVAANAQPTTSGSPYATTTTEETPAYPYDVTFVWRLSPDSTSGNPFAQPQDLIAYGSDANDSTFIPAFADDACSTYQIDHYRVTDDASQATIDRMVAEKTLDKGQDTQVGYAWSSAHKQPRFWQFRTQDATCTQPVLPAVENGVCTAAGDATEATLATEETTGVRYDVEGVVANGETVTVTATAEDGYSFSSEFTDTDKDWTFVSERELTKQYTFPAVDCDEKVTPVAPVVTEAQCTAPGDASAPTLTLAETEGITYRTEGEIAAGSTVTVTATADEGYVLENAQSFTSNGWTANEDGTATTTVAFADALDCSVATAPAAPTLTNAVCTADGTVTTPTLTLAETENVSYETTGSVAAGEKVSVVATPAAGYTLSPVEGWNANDDGTATTVATFDAAPECATTPVTPTTPPTVAPPAAAPAVTPAPSTSVAPVAVKSSTAAPALAVTGNDDASPWALAALGMLLVGGATVAAARLRAARASD